MEGFILAIVTGCNLEYMQNQSCQLLYINADSGTISTLKIGSKNVKSSPQPGACFVNLSPSTYLWSCQPVLDLWTHHINLKSLCNIYRYWLWHIIHWTCLNLTYCSVFQRYFLLCEGDAIDTCFVARQLPQTLSHWVSIHQKTPSYRYRNLVSGL